MYDLTETDDLECERFDAYYHMMGQVNVDNVELLQKLYPAIPHTYKYELLHQCAGTPTAEKCFGFLYGQLMADADERAYTTVLQTVVEKNCVRHLQAHFQELKFSGFRMVNVAAAGVAAGSVEAVRFVLERSPAQTAASVLTQALAAAKCNESMVQAIAPFCTSDDLPYVVEEVLKNTIFTEKHSAASIEDFVVDLDSLTFKKVYRRIHKSVKENNFERIAARHSREKMLTSLDCGEPAAAVRRKM